MENSIEGQNAPEDPAIAARNLKEFTDDIRARQNLSMGILAGLGAAIVGALLWALITSAVKYQIGYMAIGVGFMVGLSVRFGGKGMDPIYGVVGAILALLGCILGNYMALVFIVADTVDTSGFSLLFQMPPSLVLEGMMETASTMDVLFYGIAIYEGYRFSFRQISEEEIKAAMYR